MASKRAVISVLSQPLRSPTCSRQLPILPQYRSLLPHPCSQARYPLTRPRRRWESSSASSTKPYDFEQIKDLVANPSPSRILIDVREPHELASTGRIPTSQNLPISSSPDALFLPADEFEDKFDFPKPSSETEVVFYCKAGVRSRAAAAMAKMAGWEKVGEYEGSWVDWEGKGGKINRDG